MKHWMLVFGLMLAISLQGQEFTAGDIITLHVNDYSLIETNHAPIALSFTSSIPGAPISSVSSSDMFLKLSSLVPGGTNREVTVRLSSGNVPAGTKLTILPAVCTTTNSGGDLGVVVNSPVTLNSTDQMLIYNIGSCYTGTGYTDGYQMTFEWSPIDLDTNYKLIKATTEPTEVVVVFTITAHDGNM